ncbi:ribonuclease H-like domain-containing protein, partial [Tanacetum coccineum]
MIVPLEEGASDVGDSEILEEKDSKSEGDDSYYQEFNDLVNYYNLSLENINFSTSLNKIVELKTFDEASKDIRKPVGSKWVFKVKYNSIEELKRFNARCILSIDVHNNWLVFQLDINNGFLYGDLVEDVYMSLLYGYSNKNDTRALRYFLGIEVLEANNNLYLTHRKYYLELLADFDSDWAKSKIIRKSITGFAVFVGKNLVSWKSKKQSMLSKSSAKAEYRAINSVTCEVIWIIKILAELNIDTSLHVPFHCDNNSAIQIAANPIFHERTKQFEIELFFLRGKISNGIVRTVKVKFADNTADIFTK